MSLKFELSIGEFMLTIGRSNLFTGNAWKALYNHLSFMDNMNIFLGNVDDSNNNGNGVIPADLLFTGFREVNTDTLIKMYSVKHSEITGFDWDDIKLRYLLLNEDGIIAVENNGEQPDTWLVPFDDFKEAGELGLIDPQADHPFNP